MKNAQANNVRGMLACLDTKILVQRNGHAHMYGCTEMYGCTDAGVHRGIGIASHRFTAAQQHGCMDAWLHGCMDV